MVVGAEEVSLLKKRHLKMKGHQVVLKSHDNPSYSCLTRPCDLRHGPMTLYRAHGLHKGVWQPLWPSDYPKIATLVLIQACTCPSEALERHRGTHMGMWLPLCHPSCSFGHFLWGKGYLAMYVCRIKQKLQLHNQKLYKTYEIHFAHTHSQKPTSKHKFWHEN